MTHEELLAKIDHMWDDDFDYVIKQNRKALRAVVELHKPSKTQVVWDKDIPACSACAVEDDYYNVEYPCLTIQVIKKELQ